MIKKAGAFIIILSVFALVIGIVFVQQGFSKEGYLVRAMQEEQIELDGVNGIIDTAEEAQVAGDTVREHRHGIAPTYGDLLGGERFNPEEPAQLTYAQALNLENYLYLAVASFGLATVVKGAGAFMILTSLAMATAGFGMWRIGGQFPASG